MTHEMKLNPDIDKEHLQKLVDTAREAQSEFWDALREIENYVGVDIDDLEQELQTHDADSILENAKDNDTLRERTRG